MKRATYKEIVSWFSLDKYEYILNLSVRHAMAEAYIMEYHHDRLEYSKEEEFIELPFPMITDIGLFDDELKYGQLSDDPRGIIPMGFNHLCELVNSCIADGRIIALPSGQLKPREDLDHQDIYNQKMLYEYGEPDTEGHIGILVDIGLDLMSDEEMIASFKVLIKKWREQTGIAEPEYNDRRRFGASTIAKIYNYKVLPYLDIARWAKINNKTVSNELYARLLFPEPLPTGDIKGGNHVRDSVRPFADDMRDLLNRVSVKKYFANNPEYEHMRFSDFLKIVEL
ncbi:DUF6387 family protein [Rosenbergiella collisarenosi]|uniref:DUF6387 family protein n=1 Tax=Rosenbergiella collisarenosi TaxID=1544695 RepID=UPI001F4E8BC7|nr:DUF6387 family protein [Rosenbergiella collisarenosi]